MFNPPLCWPINGIWFRGSLPPQPHSPSFLPTSWLHLLSLLSYLFPFPGDNRIPQSLIFGLFSFYRTLFFRLTSVSPICPSPSFGTSSPNLFHVLQLTRYPKHNISKLTPYSSETPLHLQCSPVQLMTATSSPSSKSFHVTLDVDACLSPTLHIWPSGSLAETIKADSESERLTTPTASSPTQVIIISGLVQWFPNSAALWDHPRILKNTNAWLPPPWYVDLIGTGCDLGTGIFHPSLGESHEHQNLGIPGIDAIIAT